MFKKKQTLLKLESKGFEFYRKTAEKGGEAFVRKERLGGSFCRRVLGKVSSLSESSIARMKQ